MSTCPYCGKPRCHHLGPEVADPKAPRGADLPSTQSTPAPEMYTTVYKPTPHRLFALTDRHELLCVVCSRVIVNGRNQAYERAHHGERHVREGVATANRNGLPEGCVQYFVKAPA